MSWFASAQAFVAKYGKAAGFVAKHIVANAIPGGAVVGDLIQSVLNLAQESAKNAQEKALAKASAEELRRIGAMLEECLGPLAVLCDSVAALDGLPDAVERLIRLELARHAEVREGFRNLGVIFSRIDDLHDKTDDLHQKFDRLQAQIEELLRLAESKSGQAGSKPAASATASASTPQRGKAAPAPTAQPENWIACGGVEISLTASFDRTAYAADDDPNVRFLLDMAIRRGRSAPSAAVMADIVLVLDVSRSMNRPDRYPLLCKAVDVFLRRLKPTDQAAIVLFSTAADRVMKFHTGDKATRGVSRILERMDRSSIRFGKHTCLAPALGEALALFRSSRAQTVRRVYILTDGELHDTEACVEQLAHTSSRRIEVHVYGFGNAFDSAALKHLVRAQLGGGSVKPICTEEDIVETFAHVAEVNSRLVARDARLVLEFNPQVVCGDGWTFRPLARHLGRVRDRRLEHELGGLEEDRCYSLLFEVQLPPDRSVTTPVAYARLAWQDDKGGGQHWQVIGVPRLLAGDTRVSEAAPRVTQAFAMLDVLRHPEDKKAETAAAEARLQLALVERRQDPKLLAALAGHLAVLQGRSDAGQMQQEMLAYLDTDNKTVDPDEMAQYVVADQRSVAVGDHQSDPVGRLRQLQAKIRLVQGGVLPLLKPDLEQVELQVKRLRAEISQKS
jgi:Mg-chelatase subunit ChlD